MHPLPLQDAHLISSASGGLENLREGAHGYGESSQAPKSCPDAPPSLPSIIWRERVLGLVMEHWAKPKTWKITPLPRFSVLNTLLFCVSPPAPTPVSAERNPYEAQPNSTRRESVNLAGSECCVTSSLSASDSASGQWDSEPPCACPPACQGVRGSKETELYVRPLETIKHCKI